MKRTDQSSGDPFGGNTVCAETNRDLRRRRWAWGFSAVGFLSLLWFLVRVIPKPSRAAYPCQRAAFPIASSFVVWVTALLGSAFAWRKSRRDPRFWRACLWGAAALGLGALVMASLPSARLWADNPPHGPLGVAKGIFPGRVTWVHAPEATSWDRYSSAEHWFETNHTDLAVVGRMLSKAVRSVGGGNSDASAWAAIFRYFNVNHGRGDRGYEGGEKIAIKINLATCNAKSGTNTVDIYGTYEKQNAYQDGHWLNTIDNSPQMLLSLLRELVYSAGISQTNIYLGDTTANFPKYLWDRLHPEFPGVHYFDNFGGQGRMRTEFSSVPFDWSANGAGKSQDYVPMPFAQADYVINFAVLKGHSVGVTLCGKNWYGGLLRTPDGYYRDANGHDQGGTLTNYLNLHQSTPLPSVGGTPGLGHYRAMVDLMGHPALGGKTLLCLVDGLYAGFFWDSHPYYKWNMVPFNADWPSSLFVSQDPVAIDSVCYDFLLNEWPNIVNNGSESAGNDLQGGAEDYLHEAAEANNPASGTVYDPGKTGVRLASLGAHEHWNDPINKQYSRNLGTGLGIELVPLNLTNSPPAPPTALAATDVAETGFTANWSAAPGATGYRLDISTNGTFSNYLNGYQDLDAGNVTSLPVTGLDAGRYYYRVRAYTANGTSSDSAVVSVAVTVTLCHPGIILNSGFEGGTNAFGIGANWIGYQRGSPPPSTVWTIQTASPPPGGGSQYQQIANTSSAGGGGVRQDIAGCAIGAAYQISGWMRGNSVLLSTCTVKVSPSASTNWPSAIDLSPPQTFTGNHWTNFSGTVVATGTSMTIWLDGQTGGSGQNKAECFDAVTVRCLGPMAPPLLEARRSGTNLIFSWLTNYGNFGLIATTNPVTGATWRPVQPAPTVVGITNVVTNAMSGDQRFYRLMLP